jgi:hypothetical protein
MSLTGDACTTVVGSAWATAPGLHKPERQELRPVAAHVQVELSSRARLNRLAALLQFRIALPTKSRGEFGIQLTKLAAVSGSG